MAVVLYNESGYPKLCNPHSFKHLLKRGFYYTKEEALEATLIKEEEALAKKKALEEAPVKEAPVKEAPVKEAHVKEAPVKEAPVKEAPVKEKVKE